MVKAHQWLMSIKILTICANMTMDGRFIQYKYFFGMVFGVTENGFVRIAKIRFKRGKISENTETNDSCVNKE